MKARKEKPQTCVYCLKRQGTTKDHVPSKNLFPVPKPNNLLTVPSCIQCNQGYQKDEEYFLAMITFTEAGVSSEGKRLWQQKLGRMHRRNTGLTRIIRNSFSQEELVTPAGLYLGDRLAIEPNWPRVKNVFTKMVKGLYYYEYQEPLPVLALTHFIMLTNSEIIEEINRNVVRGKNGWPGVLEYKRNRLPKSPITSLWLFLLYDTFLFGLSTYDETFHRRLNALWGAAP